MIPSKLYDVLKYVAIIALPALATFWTVVGAVWNAPHTDEVVKTIVALGTLLGALLVLTTIKYNSSDARFDGSVFVQETPPGEDDQITHFNLDPTPEEAANKGEVRLKVEKHPAH